jgi:formylmethanofuran dehydrogenase subunit D
MSKIKVNLITGRSLLQGMSKEQGKITKRYMDAVSICEIHPKDIEALGIKPNTNVKVTTKFGSVVVKAVTAVSIAEPGKIFIPYGPYAAIVIDYDTSSSGMPTYKGIEAEVEPTDEHILDIKQIIAIYKGEK